MPFKFSLKKLCLIACFFIVPLITVSLALQSDLLKYNFTYLSTQSDTRLLYMVWAITTISFTALSVYEIKKKYRLFKPTLNQCIYLFLILIISSFIPYSSTDNLISFIHVAFAYIALIYFNYILFTIYNFMKLNNIKISIYAGYLYVLQFSLCFVLSMMFGSISSLVEVIYTISTSFIIGLLLIKNGI
ncbi:MAG: hypothetical protein GX675_00030 [Erysipelotrichaceae bacterium]|nr:hypothetical protein [Erysipelotrichaceae bacterium]